MGLIIPAEQCPACFAILERREVTPCEVCGAAEDCIKHFSKGRHIYGEWQIFDGLSLDLSDTYRVDLSSFDPTNFGLPKETRTGLGKMIFVRPIRNPAVSTDKYCPD